MTARPSQKNDHFDESAARAEVPTEETELGTAPPDATLTETKATLVAATVLTKDTRQTHTVLAPDAKPKETEMPTRVDGTHVSQL